MERITFQVRRSIDIYRRRRRYERLEGSSRSRNRSARLGEGTSRSQRSWKLRVAKLSLRLKIKIPSPMKLLVRLRDAYVHSMLKLAGETRSFPLAVKKKKNILTTEQTIQKALQVSGVHGDFERRMMVHIYNHLVAP